MAQTGANANFGFFQRTQTDTGAPETSGTIRDGAMSQVDLGTFVSDGRGKDLYETKGKDSISNRGGKRDW